MTLKDAGVYACTPFNRWKGQTKHTKLEVLGMTLFGNLSAFKNASMIHSFLKKELIRIERLSFSKDKELCNLDRNF